MTDDRPCDQHASQIDDPFPDTHPHGPSHDHAKPASDETQPQPGTDEWTDVPPDVDRSLADRREMRQNRPSGGSPSNEGGAQAPGDVDWAGMTARISTTFQEIGRSIGAALDTAKERLATLQAEREARGDYAAWPPPEPGPVQDHSCAETRGGDEPDRPETGQTRTRVGGETRCDCVWCSEARAQLEHHESLRLPVGYRPVWKPNGSVGDARPRHTAADALALHRLATLDAGVTEAIDLLNVGNVVGALQVLRRVRS